LVNNLGSINKSLIFTRKQNNYGSTKALQNIEEWQNINNSKSMEYIPEEPQNQNDTKQKSQNNKQDDLRITNDSVNNKQSNQNSLITECTKQNQVIQNNNTDDKNDTKDSIINNQNNEQTTKDNVQQLEQNNHLITVPSISNYISYYDKSIYKKIRDKKYYDQQIQNQNNEQQEAQNNQQTTNVQQLEEQNNQKQPIITELMEFGNNNLNNKPKNCYGYEDRLSILLSNENSPNKINKNQGSTVNQNLCKLPCFFNFNYLKKIIYKDPLLQFASENNFLLYKGIVKYIELLSKELNGDIIKYDSAELFIAGIISVMSLDDNTFIDFIGDTSNLYQETHL